MSKWLKGIALFLLLPVLTACSSINDVAANVYSKAKPTVVAIYTRSSPKEEFIFDATGFAVRSPELIIVTAGHVTDNSKLEFRIKTSEGKWEDVTIIPTKTEHLDIGFLKPKDKDFDIPSLTLSTDPAIGTDIFVIGHPSPTEAVFFNWIQPGIINGYLEDKTGLVTSDGDFTGDYMGISATIHPGNSGSPVLNSASEVVGIAVCGVKSSIAPNLQFAVPVSLLKKELSLLQ